MTRRIVLFAAVILCLSRPSVVLAQLTADEYKQFIQLLNEKDAKPVFDKRLKLIADAIEREGDPKRRLNSTYQVDLKFARIPAADGVPFLMERLDHPDDTAKRIVVRMLGAYGPEAKTAAPAVLELLKEKRTLRVEAITALGRLDTSNVKIAEAILEHLDAADPDVVVHRAALPALLAMSGVVPKSAVPRIAKLQEHRFSDIGANAHELVGKMLMLERPDVDKLRAMEMIDWRESPDKGYAAFASIASLGPKADFAIPLLLDVFDSMPPAYIELVAMDTLFKMRTGHPKAIEAILSRLSTKDPYVQLKARSALTYLDLKQLGAVSALAGGLKHKDVNARLHVASVLTSADDPLRVPPAAHAELLTPLLEAFKSLDESAFPYELDVYMRLLRRFGTRAAPAGEKLAKLYESEIFVKRLGPSSVQVRGKIIACLANIGVPASFRPTIMQVLEKGFMNQPDGGYAYAAAARAAATFAEPKDAVPLLLPGLQIKGPEKTLDFIDWSADGPIKPTTVKLEVMRALAKMGPGAADALPMIKEISEATDEGPLNIGIALRQEARRAYQAIAGEALPPLKGVFADGKKDLLHLDERLQVKMTLKLRAPRAQDVLKRLEQATKLKFTMDENIDTETPAFGSTYSMGIPAYVTMRQLASAKAVQGVWEDTGDGYRLIATSKKPNVAKGKFPPFRDDSFDTMPDDPRLQKILTFQMADPTVTELLKFITDNTGVQFTVEKVNTETPYPGGVSWQKVSAWQVLRSIAESPRVDGTWEKVGDAYHLRGTFVPLAVPVVKGSGPAPIALPPVGTGPEAKEAPAKPRTSLYIALGILAAIFLGAAFLLVVRLLLFRNYEALDQDATAT